MNKFTLRIGKHLDGVSQQTMQRLLGYRVLDEFLRDASMLELNVISADGRRIRLK